jgi:hypothetical protein
MGSDDRADARRGELETGAEQHPNQLGDRDRPMQRFKPRRLPPSNCKSLTRS